MQVALSSFRRMRDRAGRKGLVKAARWNGELWEEKAWS
jgi:hypothetical protein